MIAATVIALLAVTATAANSSSLFFLQVSSSDKSIQGQRFGTCHIGAAIESICLYPNDTQVFHLNTTSTGPPIFPTGVVAEGLLTWDLQISGGQVYSQAMGLNPVPQSNVAGAVLGLSTRTNVAFSEDQSLGLVSYIDDSVSPPKSTQGTFLSYWHVCENNFNGYVYQTLSWIYGGGKPTQPSCKPATVKVVYQ